MGRVINTENPGTERNRLKKSLVLAVRQMLKQQEANDETRDLIAFILLTLERITETVDISVEAWEKRGYWLKSDRFRMEWDWAQILAARLRPNVLAEDYPKVIPDLIAIGQTLNNITVSDNHRLGTPWVGAWERLIQLQNKFSRS